MRKLLALPFGLVFVVLLIAASLVFSLRSFAFDPAFYTTALKNEGLFLAIQKDPVAYFDWGGLNALNPLPADTQRKIYNAIVPSDWLEQQIHNAITNVLAWFHSDQPPPPRISIDFRPIKDRLQGPPGQQIAADVVAGIPDCTPDQHPDLSGRSVPECLPTGLDRSAVTDYVAGVINQAADEIPDGVDVGPNIVNSGRWSSLITGRSWIRLLDVGIFLLIGLALLVWFIGALIAGHDFKDGLRWAGGWLLTGSIIVFGLGVFLLIARDGIFASASFLQSTADNLTPAAMTAIRNVAATFIQQLAVRLIVPGGILFVLSFALIVGGRPKTN